MTMAQATLLPKRIELRNVAPEEAANPPAGSRVPSIAHRGGAKDHERARDRDEPAEALASRCRAAKWQHAGRARKFSLLGDAEAMRARSGGRIISLHTKTLLEHLGHIVVGIAVSAEQAVSIAAKEQPDVVLMDIRLNGARDGIDAALEIRNSLGIGSIFVTANSDPETRQRAKAAEPLEFLEKPLTEHRLRFGLSRLLPQ